MTHYNKPSATYTPLQSGSLLISTPVNLHFKNPEMVILVTHHSEAGTTGIVLNQDLPGSKILKYINDGDPVELKYGGPHYSQCESYIVVYPSIKNGWKDSVYWSSDVRDLMTILHFMSDYNIRYGAYYGCLKWLPEELEQDLLKGMWWLTNDYPVNSLFDCGDNAWSGYVKRYGGFYSGLVEGNLTIHYN